MRNQDPVIPIQVQAVTLLAACITVAVLSFAVTWVFFETLGAWRWPLDQIMLNVL